MLATLIDPAGEGAGLVIHSALFRRSAFGKVGAWDESLVGADLDYWLRSAWAGCTFTYSAGAWVFHRRRPAQMSSDFSVMVDRTIKTFTKALSYVDREPYRSNIRARLAGLRYAAAIGNPDLPRQQAIEELKAARELDGTRISALPYGIAYAAATIPGARRLLRLAPFSAMRKKASAAMGVRD